MKNRRLFVIWCQEQMLKGVMRKNWQTYSMPHYETPKANNHVSTTTMSKAIDATTTKQQQFENASRFGYVECEPTYSTA